MVCGTGRDRVRAEVLDELDVTCEVVDYGPTGRIGRLRTKTGGGRFVTVPGQPYTRVDRRILPDVLYLIRRYHLLLGDGYKVGGNHKLQGEHPLGLGLDIYPGAGGSWSKVDRLARWAEPRQNKPPAAVPVGGLQRRLQPRPGQPPAPVVDAHRRAAGRPVRTVWSWTVE